MITLKARIHVADGRLQADVADQIPPGDHEAVIMVKGKAQSTPRFRLADLPVHHGPWDERISLRRQDMYGDDGR